jgi:hypothetical protein
MPRVLVVDDHGGLTWCERVRTEDFETEHFQRCLTDRLRWAVSDAETGAQVSAIPPLRISSQARFPARDLEPV